MHIDQPQIDNKNSQITFESQYRRLGYQLLQSSMFENFSACVIFMNFVVVIVETDFGALEEAVPIWVEVCNWLIFVVFLIELILRLFVLRKAFFHETWNIFDFFIILIDVVLSIVGMAFGKLIDVSCLRVLRLARLARAAKIVKLFPELYLMLAGLAGATKAILWGTVLLAFSILIFAVLAVQFIHPINKELGEMGVYTGCDRCPHAYESTFRAALTFTQQVVAGDSWGQVTIPVIEHNPTSFIVFFLVFATIGLAITNLMLAVVVNVATETRDKINQQMQDKRLLERLEAQGELVKLCKGMDMDGNGYLTEGEVFRGYEEQEDFRNILTAMGIGEEDLHVVWTILDSDRSGTVDTKEFVTQVYKMRASDTQFMLAYIKWYIAEIRERLKHDLEELITKMDQEVEKIDDEVTHLEQAAQETMLASQAVEAEVSFERQVSEVSLRGASKAGSDKRFEPADAKVLQSRLQANQAGILASIETLEDAKNVLIENMQKGAQSLPSTSMQPKLNEMKSPPRQDAWYADLSIDSRHFQSEVLASLKAIERKLEFHLMNGDRSQAGSFMEKARSSQDELVMLSPVSRARSDTLLARQLNHGLPEVPEGKPLGLWPQSCCQSVFKPVVTAQ